MNPNEPMKIEAPPPRDKAADLRRFQLALSHMSELIANFEVENPDIPPAMAGWAELTQAADELGLPGAHLMTAVSRDPSQENWPFIWEGIWSDGLITQRREPAPPPSLPVLINYLKAWAGRHKGDCPHELLVSRCRAGDRLIITWDHRDSSCRYANDPNLSDVDKARRFVDEVYMLVTEEDDDTESAVSMQVEPEVVLPWVAAHRLAVDSVKAIGAQAARQLERPVRLVRFVRAEATETFQPMRRV